MKHVIDFEKAQHRVYAHVKVSDEDAETRYREIKKVIVTLQKDLKTCLKKRNDLKKGVKACESQKNDSRNEFKKLITKFDTTRTKEMTAFRSKGMEAQTAFLDNIKDIGERERIKRYFETFSLYKQSMTNMKRKGEKVKEHQKQTDDIKREMRKQQNLVRKWRRYMHYRNHQKLKKSLGIEREARKILRESKHNRKLRQVKPEKTGQKIGEDLEVDAIIANFHLKQPDETGTHTKENLDSLKMLLRMYLQRIHNHTNAKDRDLFFDDVIHKTFADLTGKQPCDTNRVGYFCTEKAYSDYIGRLKHGDINYLSDALTTELRKYTQYKDIFKYNTYSSEKNIMNKLKNQYCPIIVDGTSINAPQTLVKDQIRRWNDKDYCQVTTLCCLDYSTNTTVCLNAKPGGTESILFRDYVQTIENCAGEGVPNLFIGDGAYGIPENIGSVLERGDNFLFRLNTNSKIFKKAVENNMMCNFVHKEHEYKLRVVEYNKKREETERERFYLVTNMTDELDDEDVKQCYDLRWSVEVKIGHLKRNFDVKEFRHKTFDSIKKRMEMTRFLSVLTELTIAITTAYCDVEMKCNTRYSINRKNAVEILTHKLIPALLFEEKHISKCMDMLPLIGIKIHYVDSVPRKRARQKPSPSYPEDNVQRIEKDGY